MPCRPRNGRRLPGSAGESAPACRQRSYRRSFPAPSTQGLRPGCRCIDQNDAVVPHVPCRYRRRSPACCNGAWLPVAAGPLGERENDAALGIVGRDRPGAGHCLARDRRGRDGGGDGAAVSAPAFPWRSVGNPAPGGHLLVGRDAGGAGSSGVASTTPTGAGGNDFADPRVSRPDTERWQPPQDRRSHQSGSQNATGRIFFMPRPPDTPARMRRYRHYVPTFRQKLPRYGKRKIKARRGAIRGFSLPWQVASSAHPISPASKSAP